MSAATNTDKYNSIFATRLRGLLEKRKITMTELSDVIGVTRQAVSQYQDGSTQPNAGTITKIAIFFNVSTDYLLGLSDVKSTDTELKGVCEYTGLSEETIGKLHERAEFDKKYPQYTNGLEHLDAFIENYGLYIFDYLSEYIESVSLCGALKREYSNADFTPRGLVINMKKGEVKRKAFSEDEKRAVECYDKEIKEKQPLYLYNLQKMFIEFAEKYGEAKEEQATMKEIAERRKMHSDSVQKYNDELKTSLEDVKNTFERIAEQREMYLDFIQRPGIFTENVLNKIKDGAKNGEHTGKTE